MRDLTDIKQREERIKRDAQETEVLGDIGRIITSSLDIYEVYERFSEKVAELIPFDRITVNLIDLERGVFQEAYLSGTIVPDRESGNVVPLDGTIAQEVVCTQSGLIIQGDEIGQLNARFPGAIPGYDAGLRSLS